MMQAFIVTYINSFGGHSTHRVHAFGKCSAAKYVSDTGYEIVSVKLAA